MIGRLPYSLLFVLALSAATPAAAEEAAPTLVNRSIGYVLTGRNFASYYTTNQAECPNGLDEMGPRQQFNARFPDDGTKRTYMDTAMAYEAEVWFPSADKDPFPIPKNVSKISFGMNLDGKVGPHDFVSPDGEPGIDNQFYRATGCIRKYRSSGGSAKDDYDRLVIELTDVDSLENDSDVTLTTYRGLDPLFTDAAGKEVLPRGTQRLDMRWGKEFIQHFHGKIVNGILTTEPADLVIPTTGAFYDVSAYSFRGLRWRLNVTPLGAQGLIAGYLDLKKAYRQMNQNTSTHHSSYGQLAMPDLYRALRREADGYPDPQSGEFTAISSAMQVRLQQVFIQHAPQMTSSDKEHQDIKLKSSTGE